MITTTLSLWAMMTGLLVPPPAATRPTSRPAATAPAGDNPAAEGFDREGSDPRAIEIADAVMAKLGGRAAWDATRYIVFEFFGSRRHVWDRHTGDVRIEGTVGRTTDDYVILMNVHDGAGRAWQAGRPLEGETLKTMLRQGRSRWINDTYWLVMPYKLKDSGVTLTHVGRRPTADGAEAEVLKLRFAGVGDTPDNKYHVYVGVESGLVEQWDFFRDAADESPQFSTPWKNWRKYGSIMLSGDRGEMRGRPIQLSHIAVHDRLPASVMTEPGPTNLFGGAGGDDQDRDQDHDQDQEQGQDQNQGRNG